MERSVFLFVIHPPLVVAASRGACIWSKKEAAYIKLQMTCVWAAVRFGPFKKENHTGDERFVVQPPDLRAFPPFSRFQLV